MGLQLLTNSRNKLYNSLLAIPGGIRTCPQTLGDTHPNIVQMMTAFYFWKGSPCARQHAGRPQWRGVERYAAASQYM